jgi:hypothetical protein
MTDVYTIVSYHLLYLTSGDKVFLDKAKDITVRLLPAWDKTSSILYNRLNLAHNYFYFKYFLKHIVVHK